jgi:hypothetical protein
LLGRLQPVAVFQSVVGAAFHLGFFSMND